MTDTSLLVEPPISDRMALSVTGLVAHCSAFALLLLVGSLGLNSERAAGLSRSVHTDELHALFAFLLCTSVAVRCFWSWKALTRASDGIRREFDRLTARSIYLLLYSLAGFQLITELVGQTPLHMEHCQFFLFCGVAAVLLVRICAVLQRRHYGQSLGTLELEHYVP